MRDKICGSIYKIENIENKKCYIGLTTRGTIKRLLEHLNSTNYDDSFHNELRSNPDKFSFTTLESNIVNKEILEKLEAYYIGLFNSYENGYNKLRFKGDIKIKN